MLEASCAYLGSHRSLPPSCHTQTIPLSLENYSASFHVGHKYCYQTQNRACCQTSLAVLTPSAVCRSVQQALMHSPGARPSPRCTGAPFPRTRGMSCRLLLQLPAPLCRSMKMAQLWSKQQPQVHTPMSPAHVISHIHELYHTTDMELLCR